MYRTVSVQLPTYNRKNTLQKCLQALFQQTYPNEFIEIIVVDDGSTDETEQHLNEISQSSPIAIKYIKQNNQGHARARNTGILAAERDIILMLDDDVLAVPDLIKEHMLWHNSYPEEKTAILGYITWSPEVIVDDFMWWCENGGPLTRYHLIEKELEVGCSYFYSGNVSLKKSLLQTNLFDPDFHFGFDDFELGYRLTKQGLRIFYNKQAIGYHYSKFDIDKMIRRCKTLAVSAKILHAKWPELAGKVGKPRSLLVLKIAKIVSLLIYPVAKLIGWNRMVYHYRYGNRLSTEFSKVYSKTSN